MCGVPFSEAHPLMLCTLYPLLFGSMCLLLPVNHLRLSCKHSASFTPGSLSMGDVRIRKSIMWQIINQIQEILSYLMSLSVDSIQISPVASFQPSIIITLSDPGPLRNRHHFLSTKSDDLSREGMARLRPEDGARGKGVKGLGSGKAKKIRIRWSEKRYQFEERHCHAVGSGQLEMSPAPTFLLQLVFYVVVNIVM